MDDASTLPPRRHLATPKACVIGAKRIRPREFVADSESDGDNQEPCTTTLLPFVEDYGKFRAAAVDRSMLERYAIVHSGFARDVPPSERQHTLVEISSSDEDRDQRGYAGAGGSHMGSFQNFDDDLRYALRVFARVNGGTKPTDPTQLLPYFNPRLSAQRQTRFLQTGAQLLQ